MHRRQALSRFAALPWLGGHAGLGAHVANETSAALAVPGPRNSVSLPLELAQRLGLDRTAGLPLRLAFVGGGGVAIQELRARNVEFAVFGLPTLLRANLLGGPRMVALAAIADLPLYTLVVRSDLRGSVRRVADLAGRTLGVHSNSLQTRTTSHQLAEYLLRRHGVDMNRVRIVAAGQSWETQSSMMLARSIDASMCDEPYATRMEAEGLAFKLFCTGEAADAASVPGTGFLRAVLVAMAERVEAAALRAERAVRLVQRTLHWMAEHSADELASALQLEGQERSSMLAVARAYPRQYSRDARFSNAQLAETETFFRASNPDLQAQGPLRWSDMIDDRWVGRKP